MGKVADFIAKNNDTILVMIKMNLLPLSVMTDYEMYRMYLVTSPELGQMEKYQEVANRCKCHRDTVRKAIKKMEKPCD